VLSDPEREALQRLETSLEEWLRDLQQDLEAAAVTPGTIDDAFVERFLETAHRLSLRLNKELPPALDPEAVAEIRGHLIEALSAGHVRRGDGPLDVMDEFVIRAEAIRHIFRDALDGEPDVNQRDARALLQALTAWLPRVSRKELATLVGISERHLQRILKDGGDATRRVQLVTHLVGLLRHAWTSEGVVAWFYRRRPDLDGQAPIDVLDDPAYERAVTLAVRSGRSQHGA